MSKKPEFDVVVIGAGVVGLSIAHYLSQTKLSVLVIDSEDNFGKVTSSRNSEVIHSGIFNPQNSLKYQLCKRGNELIYKFCDANKIWYKNCGKIIVSKENEIENFNSFTESITKKGIEYDILTSEQSSKMEQHIVSDKSIYIESSGVIDSHDYMNHLFRIASNYCTFIFESNAIEIKKTEDVYELKIQRKNKEVETINAASIINCGGLKSYNIAKKIMNQNLKIPSLKFYKGSYFALSSRWKNRFDRLVYSLPQPDDSLGIHISFDQTGRTKIGPDYEKVEANNFDYTVNENSQKKFFDSAKDYIKDLKFDDLNPDYSGVRPKLFFTNGKFSEFYINEESKNGFPNLINLIGIDSPGLTCSLAIGELVVQTMIQKMNL
jgi:L-2-hydroxyglutarate oxidase LhgO